MRTDLENKPLHAKPRQQIKLTKQGKIIIISVAAVLAALIVLAAVLSIVPSDTIVKGVYAGDLNLSGMTQTDAAAAIASHEFDKGRTAFSVTSNGKSREINFTDIDLAVDSEQIAQSAFDICHTGNKASDAFQALRLKFSKKKLPVTHKADSIKLDTILLSLGDEIYGELKQHSVAVADDYNSVIVTPGVSGCSSNVESARNEVLKSLSELKFDNINVTLNKEKPQDVNVDSLASEVFSEPHDAYYAVQDGKAVVVPEVVGIELDKNDAHDKLKKLTEGGNPVEIKVTQSQPSVKAAALKEKMFNATLSSFSTKYNASAANRSKNVALAASKINNTVLAPGDVFSYNDVVGHRTAANGFLNAPVYENSKTVDGIGGGVCQVSTTLYSAVLYADLEIVYRQNHSLPVSYVPLGQDATVVDNAIDFKFKNNTNYPVKITAGASGGTLSVSIVGTKPDVEKTVKLSHKTISTTPPTTKEVKTADLPAGQRRVVSKGKTGYVVESTKTVYENGTLARTESLGKSSYKMVPEEVEVGTGAAPAATQAPAATAPTQAPAQAPAADAAQQTPAAQTAAPAAAAAN